MNLTHDLPIGIFYVYYLPVEPQFSLEGKCNSSIKINNKNNIIIINAIWEWYFCTNWKCSKVLIWILSASAMQITSGISNEFTSHHFYYMHCFHFIKHSWWNLIYWSFLRPNSFHSTFLLFWNVIVMNIRRYSFESREL